MRDKVKLQDGGNSDVNIIDGGDIFLAKSANENVEGSVKGQNF